MTGDLSTRSDGAAIMERVIALGDLAKLSPEERVAYYRATCDSMALNWLTKPFDYITLNGKLTLYATKVATDQLRTLHGVSIINVQTTITEGIYVVTVTAATKDGRQDSDIGAVPIAGKSGDALANAMKKCLTQAKRRVTLSVCGLGWLDESEVEQIADAGRVTVNAETGEIIEPATPRAPQRAVIAAPAVGAGAEGTPALDFAERFRARLSASLAKTPSAGSAPVEVVTPIREAFAYGVGGSSQETPVSSLSSLWLLRWILSRPDATWETLSSAEAVALGKWTMTEAFPTQAEDFLLAMEPPPAYDRGHYNRKWHALANGSRYADEEVRHQFIRNFSRQRYGSLRDFLNGEPEQQAQRLIEQLADVVTRQPDAEPARVAF